MKKENKKSLFRWMQKVPGGIILVPLFIGIIVNTIAPQFFEIGGFTKGMFKTGTSCMLGLFLLLNGANINVKKIGMPLYKGVVLTAIKFFFGVALGLLVSAVCGSAGFFGITPMAIICALTNSAGGEYLALAEKYGDATDAGAISILSLNDGPFFTMIAMGTAGLASIPIAAFVATLIPLVIGIVWGNMDNQFRENATRALPIVTFFMMIPIGAGMTLRNVASGGVAGLILALISAVSAFVFYFIYQLLLPRKKRNAMGAAIGTTAANATAVPSALAEADASLEQIAPAATAQVTVAAIITAFTAPLITDFLDRRMRRKKLGIYSEEAAAEPSESSE
jgi:2-keto-3-deoxygluconate permease